MAGSEVDQDQGETVVPPQPCTLPLLADPHYDVSHTDSAATTQDTGTSPGDAACTVPLTQNHAGSEPCEQCPLSSVPDLDLVHMRDTYTLPCLDLGLGRMTPVSTPIPGRAITGHGTHTPLSGTSTPIIDCKSISVDSVSLILPGPACTFETKSQLSMLSDTNSLLLPFCRICHMTGDEYDILISPCRCAGTLQFIHNTCLMRWLEITTKKSRKPPKCELCHYQYHRHKKFKFNHWRFPRVSRQDKVLHIIFLFNLLVMIGCAIATVMCFLSDKEQISNFPRNKVELTTEEIITLSCGVLFFVSFFIAMSVQIKAKHTVYQLFVKFIMQNMEWEIDQYDKSKDSMYMVKGTAAYV